MADEVDTITAKTLRTVLMPGWIDWAVKGMIVGCISGSFTLVSWGIQVDSRFQDIEQYESRIAALERKDDSYRQLVTEVAVMQSLLVAQGRQLDRLVARLDTGGTSP